MPLSVAEISKHSRQDDLWIVVNNEVYDMTDFAPSHPGGPDILYRFAGLDASKDYNEIHAPSLIRKTLSREKQLGVVDQATITAEWREASIALQSQPQSSSQSPPGSQKPPLGTIINLDDFERAASVALSEKAWAYISGASNDNISRDANKRLLRSVLFRPAVMRNVGTVDTGTSIFGCRLDIPVYISPTGTVKMASPDGEIAQAKGASAGGIIHCMSTPSSFPHEEIIDATPEHAFFQLYVNKDRAKSEEALRMVSASGKVKAIFVTADLAVVSKREDDERVGLGAVYINPNTGESASGRDSKGAGLARIAGSFIDPTLNWDDLAWVRKHTHLPIVLKGVQRWEDARLALQYGCQGIVVSNHGGRAADTAPATILTLLELHRNCPEVFGAMEVFVDGGFRRGSDVVKAICLGASAVGMGRSFLFATMYGQEGIQHAVDILRDEVETAMRLCGMSNLMRDASPEYVNTSEVDHLVCKGSHPYAVKVSRARAKL